MTLHVFTARIDCTDPDRLDITRKAVDNARRKGQPPPPGAFLAPSWGLLKPALAARKTAGKLLAQAIRIAGTEETVERMDEWSVGQAAERIEAYAWAAYTQGYIAEMRLSYSQCTRCARAELSQSPHTCLVGTFAPIWLAAEIRDAWRRGARSHRQDWEALLARNRVTLVCYCVDPMHCHRYLLRTRILPALGAIDCGELERKAA